MCFMVWIYKCFMLFIMLKPVIILSISWGYILILKSPQAIDFADLLLVI